MNVEFVYLRRSVPYISIYKYRSGFTVLRILVQCPHELRKPQIQHCETLHTPEIILCYRLQQLANKLINSTKQTPFLKI